MTKIELILRDVSTGDYMSYLLDMQGKVFAVKDGLNSLWYHHPADREASLTQSVADRGNINGATNRLVVGNYPLIKKSDGSLYLLNRRIEFIDDGFNGEILFN
jgi:hypothetical protein